MITLWIFSDIKLSCLSKTFQMLHKLQKIPYSPTSQSLGLEVYPQDSVFLNFLDTLMVRGKKQKNQKQRLLCSVRILQKPPLIPPPSSSIDFLHYCKEGTDYRALSLQKKGKVIWSVCNPVRALQAAVLSILFGYVKNVEYQQWVSVPYCWVLYELILLQSQKKRKEKKERPTAWTKSL